MKGGAFQRHISARKNYLLHTFSVTDLLNSSPPWSGDLDIDIRTGHTQLLYARRLARTTTKQTRAVPGFQSTEPVHETLSNTCRDATNVNGFQTNVDKHRMTLNSDGKAASK